jgi:hypothetical protein
MKQNYLLRIIAGRFSHHPPRALSIALGIGPSHFLTGPTRTLFNRIIALIGSTCSLNFL